ncbi:MAG: hypothetical protein MAG453_00737 [Calditrichaeota bacterium]|nr:hypothetical protein [Calditrichota bacterium]
MTRVATPIALTVAAALVVASFGCGGGGRQQPREQEEQTGPGESGRMSARGNIQLSGRQFTLGPLSGTLPESWTSQPPSSSMRLAQFHLAPAEGAADEAEVNVFYFGPDAGGIEANIKRWIGQFTGADGEPLTDADVTREEIEVNGMPVTIVQFTGTQKPSQMPGAPATQELKNWMNVSAIVNTPQGPWFFKGTGPEATMNAHANAFRKLINSLDYSDAVERVHG